MDSIASSRKKNLEGQLGLFSLLEEEDAAITRIPNPRLPDRDPAELMALEKEAGYPFQHIHGVGSYGWEWMPKLVEEKGVRNNDAIFLKEYIYNMPTVMAAADIVISRAGASTCNEIAAAGVPCILIPSPNVTANHQEKNARALEEQGAAAVILEENCTAQVVMDKIRQLLEDRDAYNKMHDALLEIAVPDSAQRMCDIMEELTSGKTKK